MKTIFCLAWLLFQSMGMALEVTEKIDDFDRTTTLRCKADAPQIAGELGFTARAVWSTGKPDTVCFLLVLNQYVSEWEWMRFHSTKMLVNDEPLELGEETFKSDVQSNGILHEMVLVALTTEQVIRVLKAKTVRLKVGTDEYRWTPTNSEALSLVFAGWQQRGGSITPYQALIEKLTAPTEEEKQESMILGANAAMQGKTVAEIEATHGKATKRDAVTGWAEWPKFRARFVAGRVVEVALP